MFCLPKTAWPPTYSSQIRGLASAVRSFGGSGHRGIQMLKPLFESVGTLRTTLPDDDEDAGRASYSNSRRGTSAKLLSDITSSTHAGLRIGSSVGSCQRTSGERSSSCGADICSGNCAYVRQVGS